MSAKGKASCVQPNGDWSGLDWTVRAIDGSCPSQPADQNQPLAFMRVKPGCADVQVYANKSLRLLRPFSQVFRSCVVVNTTLMRQLAAHSLLLVGDSTSAELFQTGCEVLAARQELFIEDARDAVTFQAPAARRPSSRGAGAEAANASASYERHKYYHWSRGGTMHWCELARRGGIRRQSRLPPAPPTAVRSSKPRTAVVPQAKRSAGAAAVPEQPALPPLEAPVLGSFSHYGVSAAHSVHKALGRRAIACAQAVRAR